ncbi:hypothetical protein KW800_02100 [Candidatus Parcubacteria bacterium]|nr:hypothetical protein [Candidatus Parcubacteria bacterium]
MEPKKTVAFVTRRFAHGELTNNHVVDLEHGEYRALILPSIHDLKQAVYVDEVVLFLDCGEEMLVDAIPEVGVPVWKYHYVICAKNITKTLVRISRIGHGNVTFTPSECGGLDTFNRLLRHYHATGETHLPGD